MAHSINNHLPSILHCVVAIPHVFTKCLEGEICLLSQLLNYCDLISASTTSLKLPLQQPTGRSPNYFKWFLPITEKQFEYVSHYMIIHL